MKIAFDIDGTLTRFPKQLREIMIKNYSIILTGSLSDLPNYDARYKQLDNIGISKTDFNEIIICCGKTVQEVALKKAEICKEMKIEMIFEDTKIFLDEINKINPEIASFLVYK